MIRIANINILDVNTIIMDDKIILEDLVTGILYQIEKDNSNLETQLINLMKDRINNPNQTE